jgi:DNA-binding CsgD family transcriptional regulator
MRDCLELGVRGWVFKSDEADELMKAVEALERHKPAFSSRVSNQILDGYLQAHYVRPKGLKTQKLSPREREVVQLLSEGKTTEEVAIMLNLSVKTAETHRSNILLKLKIHSIAALVLYAVRHEIVHVQLAPVLHFPNPGIGWADIAAKGALTEHRSGLGAFNSRQNQFVGWVSLQTPTTHGRTQYSSSSVAARRFPPKDFQGRSLHHSRGHNPIRTTAES